MKIAVGAPVAERAWILPRWWECLRAQTLQPTDYCFVYSDSQDDTEQYLSWPDMGRSWVQKTNLPYHSREDRGKDPKDPWRAKHMARLRNQLRGLFSKTNADIFISLDTDLLLEDSTIIEQLVATINEGWDVAAPLTCLHPLGLQSHCYNAGFFGGGGTGFDQIWARAEHYHTLLQPPIQIDIPMAAYAIRNHAMGMCKYQSHSQGEDVGFAQRLKAHKYRTAWRTDLKVRHVWDQSRLEGMSL